MLNSEVTNPGVNNPINLLELKPERLRGWECDPHSRCATILIPKFQGIIFGKWLQARVKEPYYRIHLDDYGSAVWEQCDGQTSVASIAAALKQRFGDKIEPLTQRLSLFLQDLEQKKLIRYTNLEPVKSAQKG